MAKPHRPTAQSSGDPEVNYPPSVVPVLLNGVSVQSRDRGAGMSGRDEPGSRCLQGPPSQGIPPSPCRTRQHPGGNPLPAVPRGTGTPLLVLPDVGDTGGHKGCGGPAISWMGHKAGRSLGTALGGFASRGDCCLSVRRSSPRASPMGQLERGRFLLSSLPW